MGFENGVNDFLSYLAAHLDPPNSLKAKNAEIANLIASSPQMNPSKWAYERLEDLIKEFEADLDDTHEVGLKIVSLGNVGIYYVQEISYWSPHILIFHCLAENGAKATLIQHYSQMNFLLISLPKLNPQEKARRVGFAVHNDEA